MQKAKPCVAIGTTISVIINARASSPLTFTIRSSSESSPQDGIISYESPIAKAMLGKEEGDTFSYSVGCQKFIGKVVQIIDHTVKQNQPFLP